MEHVITLIDDYNGHNLAWFMIDPSDHPDESQASDPSELVSMKTDTDGIGTIWTVLRHAEQLLLLHVRGLA